MSVLYRVLKLPNWFLNNEVSDLNALGFVVLPSVLPVCAHFKGSESVSSCCKNDDFHWVSALLPPHLRRLFSFGRNLSERIDF